jgi:predicted NAD/FAD-binding protein
LTESLNGRFNEVAGNVDQTMAAARGTADSLTALSNELTAMAAENRAPVRDFTSVGLYELSLLVNERTYPRLTRLFEQLQVDTADSEMSFSVQAPTQRGPLEWAGTDLNGVFAQRGNLLRPRFWRMLGELLRFNRLCTALAESGADGALSQPLGAWLDEQRFTREFRDWYLLPMLGCIWSCPTEQMQQFPLATMIRFCHNHGLIRITGRPRWRTVRGGSRSYVTKIIAALDDARSATPVRRVQRLGGGGPEEAGSAGVLVSTERGSEQAGGRRADRARLRRPPRRHRGDRRQARRR